MKSNVMSGPCALGVGVVILLLTCATPVPARSADTPPAVPDRTQVSAPPVVIAPVVTDKAATPSTGSPVAAGGVLPENLSLQSMFLHADIVVQSVMVGLLFASMVTWTVLLAKGLQLTISGQRLRRAVRKAETEEFLARLSGPENGGSEPTAVMVAATMAELRQSEGSPHDGIKDRIASRLRRIEASFARRMTRGTGLLATIGATAPFIGLFGTVWGIMNSFIGISKSQTTNLAVVAPGIAEALLATAAGLIAAIPAVVIYNMFARATGGYRANLGDLAAAIERLASRDLDVRRPTLRAAAE
jgi:biopolymer transport protein ExbB